MRKEIKFAIAILVLLALVAFGIFELRDSPSKKLPAPGTDAFGEAVSGAAVAANSAALPPSPGTPLAVRASNGPSFIASDSAARADTASSEAATAAAAEEPSGPYTPEQFQDLTKKTLRELPTPAQMRDLTEEEAHGYPEPLAKAGPMLGRIAQAVQDQPALAAAASEFYIRCSQDGDILTPVRALCYSHVIKDPKAPSAQSLPTEVVRLARLIPADEPSPVAPGK